MNADKSDFGALAAGAPSKITRSIKHSDPSLTFKTVQTGAQGEVVTEMKYTTDGKESPNSLRGAPITGNAKWEGNVLIIETHRSVQGTEIVQNDKWSLIDNGSGMRIESSIKSPKGEMQFTVVMEKQ